MAELGSIATIARESGQPIVLDGISHGTLELNAVADHKAAIHDASVLIDRILRGWHRKD
jgi:hypothetical protein